MENDWEEKLRDQDALREEYARVCRQENVVLTDADRVKVLSLAKDLSKV